ncbi:MAG: chromosome segregation protein SMC [Candidatus Nanopelagicales bacterium]
MYLKSLTLKGFKSFASTTTLEFEPGITCVVGPNGSGKSNVVDALSWVMGEQGAKTLRGGKMEDVIFSGTTDRGALGRAEVILTIDNTDGALPIEYQEVTISRIMFRSGGSEYAINGEPCRLLDIQELLSDSGIGREMHVIVGQGQLDSILRATPQERRGFIEEAAGVLKHRKRKEKTLRKLEAMQGNLIRLTDLTNELRRQLTPLGKQAEVARRADVIQREVRDAKSRLYADDLLALKEKLEAEIADETILRERRTLVETELADLRARELVLEAEIKADAPRIHAANEVWLALSGLRERYLGTLRVAEERTRNQSEEQMVFGVDPEAVEGQIQELHSELLRLQGEVKEGRTQLEQISEHRARTEAQLIEETRIIEQKQQALSDYREGIVKLEGQIHAIEQRIATREAEIERLQREISSAHERALAAETDFKAEEAKVASLNAGEVTLDDAFETAQSLVDQAENKLLELETSLRNAESAKEAQMARIETLEMTLHSTSPEERILALSSEVSGVLGSVAGFLRVQPGFEIAISRALGEAVDAIAVRDVTSAFHAVEHLKRTSAGRATFLIANTNDLGEDLVGRRLPDGAVKASDVIEADSVIRTAIHNLLHSVVITDSIEVAKNIVNERGHATAVTKDGDVLGRKTTSGGSKHAPGLLELQTALQESKSRVIELDHEIERIGFEQVKAREELKEKQKRLDATLTGLHESDAEFAALTQLLSHLNNEVRIAREQQARLQQAVADSNLALESDRDSLRAFQERLHNAQQSPTDSVISTGYRDRLQEDVENQRGLEVEARLALRTSEERESALASSIESLQRQVREEREKRERFAHRQAVRLRQIASAEAIVKALEVAIPLLEEAIGVAVENRTTAELTRDARDLEMGATRQRIRTLSLELEQLVSEVHKDEVARAEQRIIVENLENKIMEELGLDAETLIAEFGPTVLVEPTPAAPGDDIDPNAPAPEPYPYVREEQQKRLKAAEKSLNLLGKVNPLALEEFAALEERHKFLNEQLDDLRKSKNDLMAIIKDVDEKITSVLESAYRDTEREFAIIFERLFPGGEGRLVLTESDDILLAGVDIEARPPGKKLKRLSLLSGGERSLTAVAFLIALFKARPSPFYVLDEVEAALDDANLGRLISELNELRANSQLIIITHQKRTMEIADSLYGVSMRGDGISAVISQRLSEHQPQEG